MRPIFLNFCPSSSVICNVYCSHCITFQPIIVRVFYYVCLFFILSADYVVVVFSHLVSYFDCHSFKLKTLHYISYYHSYCQNLCTTFINVCMCGIHDDFNTNDMSASRKRECIKEISKFFLKQSRLFSIKCCILVLKFRNITIALPKQ